MSIVRSAARGRAMQKKQQRGAALIVALLIFVMISLLAVLVGSDFLLLMNKSSNQIYFQEANIYLRGEESLARYALKQDYENEPKKDSYYSLWAFEQPPIPLEPPVDGYMIGRLEDLQGRFNLNTLTADPGANGRSLPQMRFIRLLQVVSVDLDTPLGAAEALALSNAVIDFISPGQAARMPGGAVDIDYQSEEPSRWAGDHVLASVSELRSVIGMSSELYEALKDYVTVWPMQGGNINLNTASWQLLKTLGNDISMEPLDDQYVDIIQEEIDNNQGVESTDFFGSGVLVAQKINIEMLDLSSEYFLLHARTGFADREYDQYSVIYRNINDGTLRVEARSNTGWNSILEKPPREPSSNISPPSSGGSGGS